MSRFIRRRNATDFTSHEGACPWHAECGARGLRACDRLAVAPNVGNGVASG